MRWLGPDEGIKDPMPQVRDYDSSAYDILKTHPIVLRSFSEHFFVLAGISRIWSHPDLRPVLTYNGERKCLLFYNFLCLLINSICFNMRLVVAGMGLFERMKLSGKETIVETTEVVRDGEKPILDETADLTVAPSAPTSLLGKRKSEATVSGAFAGPSSPAGRRKTMARKGLGAPGLKPKVNLNATGGDGSSSGDSGSSEGSDSVSGSESSTPKGMTLFFR
jgi:hypothetical protein